MASPIALSFLFFRRLWATLLEDQGLSIHTTIDLTPLHANTLFSVSLIHTTLHTLAIFRGPLLWIVAFLYVLLLARLTIDRLLSYSHLVRSPPLVRPLFFAVCAEVITTISVSLSFP